MLVTCLHIEGKDLNARRLAKELGLGRDSYAMKGETIKTGPNKGRKQRMSILRFCLSKKEDMLEHMAEIERELDDFMSWIAEQRRKSKSPLTIELSIGMGVGSQKAFARCVYLPSSLMAKLAAVGISCEVWGYPSSDE